MRPSLLRVLLLVGTGVCMSSCVRGTPSPDVGDDGTQAGDTSGTDSASPPLDGDGDGYYSDGDCDDANAGIHPDADEICDGLDQDCDGSVDEDASDAGMWFADEDGDGFGDPLETIRACTAPEGFVEEGRDCDDSDPTISPAAEELCSTDDDDDCDGAANEDDAVDALAWFPDADGDGFGDAAALVTAACVGTDEQVVDGTDCDDADAAIHPGALDACDDGIDGNCDGLDLICPYSGDVDVGSAGYVWTGAHPYDAAPYQMSSAGDADGDGNTDILAGVPYARGDPEQGEVYLLLPTAAEERSLADADATCTHEAFSDYFGARVASTGDINGDGDPDVAVVTLYDSTNGYASGMVQLFDAASLLSSCDAPLSTITGSAAGDQFGSAIAHADVDGDGFDELFIDAPYNSDGGAYAGAVFMFNGPVTTAVLDASAADLEIVGSAGDYYGRVLSAGDVNDDGLADLAIGAPGDDTAAPGAGAVYILLGATIGTAGGGVLAPDISVLGELEGDAFGIGVDISGNIDGAGGSDIVAGAYNQGAGAYRPGKAYILYSSLSLGATSAVDADVGLEGESNGDWAGANVASLGDVNADGCDDVMVSAPNSAAVGVNGGIAYLLYGCSIPDGRGTLAISHARFLPEAQGDYLGIGNAGPVGHVDLNGDGVDDFLIAAPYNDRGGTLAGAIYGFPGM